MASSPLLTLRYASLEDVAQDLDMVIQSSSADQWSWQDANADEENAWSRFVQDPSSIPAEEAAAAIAGMAGKIQVTPEVALSFSLLSSVGGLGRSTIEAGVDMSAPTISSQGVAMIKEALVGRSHAWDDEGVESLFLFDLLTAAQEHVASADLAPSADSGETQQGSESANTKGTDSAASIQMSRALFWSHHLKAPSKLKDFNNWCPELRIWSIVRVGYPGYLCFEGEATAVAEMVRRVKALQWHAIQLRVNETWTWHPPSSSDGGNLAPQLEQALLSCALARDHPANTETGKVRTGCQVIESLGELVQRLRECGLPHDEISDALGIRISTTQGSGDEMSRANGIRR